MLCHSYNCKQSTNHSSDEVCESFYLFYVVEIIRVHILQTKPKSGGVQDFSTVNSFLITLKAMLLAFLTYRMICLHVKARG